MNRLSLADLKAQNIVADLEAIKGGNTSDCHYDPCAKQDEEERIERLVNVLSTLPWG